MAETESQELEAKAGSRKDDFSIDTEEIKKVLIDFLRNPVNKLKDIVRADNAYIKTALTLLIVWMAAAFIRQLCYIIDLSNPADLFRYGLVESVIALVKEIISPCLSVLVFAVILMALNKGVKRSTISLATIIVFAKLPVIAASVFSILNAISVQFIGVTSIFAGLCQMASTVLLYFAVKVVYRDQDDNRLFRKFVVVQAIFYGVKFVFSFMGVVI